MELGRGEGFRNRGMVERAASMLRGRLAGSGLHAPLKRACEAVLDRMPGDHLVSRFPGGERIRVAAAFRQITWNAEEYAAFARDVRPGDVVVDIGANLGAYSLLFAQWVGPAGHVHAFEPAPGARLGLARHAALNGMAGRITIHAEAVAGRPGTASFRAVGPHGDNRILCRPDEGSTLVRTTSVDAFCRESGVKPRLLKIDVEGAELDVLRGARETIAAGGDGLKVYVEMHPRLWPADGVSREAIERELALQRLMVERLDGSGDPWNLEGVCLRLRRCAS